MTLAPQQLTFSKKVMINSAISDAKAGARFITADIKYYFLATPMDRHECMKVPYTHLPDNIKKKYNLHTKVIYKDYIYIRIKKGMHGLKQAAILAYENLQRCIKPFGYTPVIGTVGVWQHETRPTKFCLCVDDFGIKYYSKSDAQHLLDSIGKNYKYTTDWTGRNYCGLTLDWHCVEGYVDISMSGYIEKAIHRLQYI